MVLVILGYSFYAANNPFDKRTIGDVINIFFCAATLLSPVALVFTLSSWRHQHQKVTLAQYAMDVWTAAGRYKRVILEIQSKIVVCEAERRIGNETVSADNLRELVTTELDRALRDLLDTVNILDFFTHIYSFNSPMRKIQDTDHLIVKNVLLKEFLNLKELTDKQVYENINTELKDFLKPYIGLKPEI